MRVGKGQGERETQNPKKAPGSELSAQSPMQNRLPHPNGISIFLVTQAKKCGSYLDFPPPLLPHIQSIHQLMDIWALTVIWLLLKMLL